MLYYECICRYISLWTSLNDTKYLFRLSIFVTRTYFCELQKKYFFRWTSHVYPLRKLSCPTNISVYTYTLFYTERERDTHSLSLTDTHTRTHSLSLVPVLRSLYISYLVAERIGEWIFVRFRNLDQKWREKSAGIYPGLDLQLACLHSLFSPVILTRARALYPRKVETRHLDCCCHLTEKRIILKTNSCLKRNLDVSK